MTEVWLWLGAAVAVAVGVVAWRVRARAARPAEARRESAVGANAWLEELYLAPCHVREETDHE